MCRLRHHGNHLPPSTPNSFFTTVAVLIQLYNYGLFARLTFPYQHPINDPTFCCDDSIQSVISLPVVLTSSNQWSHFLLWWHDSISDLTSCCDGSIHSAISLPVVMTASNQWSHFLLSWQHPISDQLRLNSSGHRRCQQSQLSYTMGGTSLVYWEALSGRMEKTASMRH